MVTAENDGGGPAAPLWIRRPEVPHLAAYGLAALVFIGQVVAVVVTSAASFAVAALGRDPLSVWMMAVLVLFSFTLRGRQPVAGTAVVAGFFLAAFMTVDGFRAARSPGPRPCSRPWPGARPGPRSASTVTTGGRWWKWPRPPSPPARSRPPAG